MPRKRIKPVPKDQKQIGNNVRKIRHELDLSQMAFAEKLDMNVSAIQRIEEGGDFKVSTLKKMVKILNVSVKEILGFQ